MPGEIRIEREGAIARVVLAHPGKLNAMSRGMWRALREAFLALHADADCRVIVVQGEGGQFCAGGDIAEYPEFRFDPEALADFHERDVWGGLAAVLDCDVPVIACIEGACMGAGVEIASCCDLRHAGASAKFGAPIARLGFPMAPREMEVVLAAAGEATVREMLLAAGALDATEMRTRGFLHAVWPDADVLAHSLHLAGRIARLAPQAARLNKQALRSLRAYHPVARWSAAELAAAYAYAPGEEHREGVSAFLDKRQPRF